MKAISRFISQLITREVIKLHATLSSLWIVFKGTLCDTAVGRRKVVFWSEIEHVTETEIFFAHFFIWWKYDEQCGVCIKHMHICTFTAAFHLNCDIPICFVNIKCPVRITKVILPDYQAGKFLPFVHSLFRKNEVSVWKRRYLSETEEELVVS